ncbi:MAG: hypothetical protein ACI835_005630 [Planctomycetota bacterium]
MRRLLSVRSHIAALRDGALSSPLQPEFAEGSEVANTVQVLTRGLQGTDSESKPRDSSDSMSILAKPLPQMEFQRNGGESQPRGDGHLATF